jgi:hypothetical protein
MVICSKKRVLLMSLSGRARIVSVPRTGRFKRPRLASAPFGLRASRVSVDGEELAVFSFPLRHPRYPTRLVRPNVMSPSQCSKGYRTPRSQQHAGRPLEL